MIAIRCDATQQMGYGHVKRCLALASQYRRLGLDVVFVMQHPLPRVLDLLSEHGMTWVALTTHDACLDYLLAEKERIRLAIIDHYEWDLSIEQQLGADSPVLVIDDLCRPHWCDILVDQTCGRTAESYRDKLYKPNTTALMGSAYTLLDPVYQGVESSGNPDNVLISFGAMDSRKLTLKVLDILLPAVQRAVQGRNVVFHVPLSSASPCLGEVLRYASRFETRVRVYTDLPDLTSLYRICGLAVGAPGTSVLERVFCGLDNLTIVAADNQMAVGQALSDLGIAPCVGTFQHLDRQRLIDRFLGLLTHAGPKTGTGTCLVDGRGPARVVRATLPLISPVTLRRAVADDKDVLFRFQREKGARRYFTAPDPPSRSEHEAWFEQTLARMTSIRDVVVYMIEWNGRPVGYIRLEGRDIPSISILISRDYQGVGLGRTALKRALETTGSPCRCRARIHPDNQRSIALFSTAGFTRSHDGVYEYDPVA